MHILHSRPFLTRARYKRERRRPKQKVLAAKSPSPAHPGDLAFLAEPSVVRVPCALCGSPLASRVLCLAFLLSPIRCLASVSSFLYSGFVAEAFHLGFIKCYTFRSFISLSGCFTGALFVLRPFIWKWGVCAASRLRESGESSSNLYLHKHSHTHKHIQTDACTHMLKYIETYTYVHKRTQIHVQIVYIHI